jgi:hypothetical protein
MIWDDPPPDDDGPWCPCPPDGRMRIVEAVIIASLSAVAAKVVEHFYEEFKQWRKERQGR